MANPNVLSLDNALGGDAPSWGHWFLDWQAVVTYDRDHPELGVNGIEGPFDSMGASAELMPEGGQSLVEQHISAPGPVVASEAAIFAAGIRVARAAIRAGKAENVYGRSPSFPMPEYRSPLLAAAAA